MAAITPNTLHRREYKYLVDEDTVELVRRYIDGICTVDPHAERTGGRYLTDTLYLDTPQLHSYWSTVEDAGDRYKLRIRTYPSLGVGPVFLEVKRRVSESVLKTRGMFRGPWDQLLTHTTPALVDAIEPKQRRAIDNFLCFYHRSAMSASTLVRYEREPYFSQIDEYARVTFDRNVSSQRASALSLVPEHEQWTYLDHAETQRGLSRTASSVLLELKFTNLVPGWMRGMVHTLGLQRLAFCKYTRSIESLRAMPTARIARAGFWR